MTSFVIRYNVYILKDPKNFMNVDNCTIVQLQTKDQLMSTMGISLKLCFHDITCRGKTLTAQLCSCKQRISITYN